MYYLFLDIDGVLNTKSYIQNNEKQHIPFSHPYYAIDKKHLIILKKIIQIIPNIQIVLTSTWRLNPFQLNSLKIAFLDFQIPFPTLKTLSLSSMDRYQEIKAFIDQYHIQNDEIIIIDDAYIKPLHDRQIQTSYEEGLCPKHIEEILQLIK